MNITVKDNNAYKKRKINTKLSNNNSDFEV